MRDEDIVMSAFLNFLPSFSESADNLDVKLLIAYHLNLALLYEDSPHRFYAFQYSLIDAIDVLKVLVKSLS